MSIGGTVSQSGFANNYLYHAEAEERADIKDRLLECQRSGTCSSSEIQSLEGRLSQLDALDNERDAILIQSLASGGPLNPVCRSAVADAQKARDSYLTGEGGFSRLWEDNKKAGQMASATSFGANPEQAAVLKGVDLGSAGGAVIASLIYGGPMAARCAMDPICRTQVVAAVGDEIAMTGGSLTVAASGTIKLGNKVVGTIHEAGDGLKIRPQTTHTQTNAGGKGDVGGATNKGKITVQDGAKPDQNELRAGEGLSNSGHDVEHRATASDLGITGQRTSDLFVNGKPVDVYTPAIGTNTNKIATNIEKKAKQGNVLVQGDFSVTQMDEIAARTFGKGKQDTIYFQNSTGVIFEFNKN